MNKVASGGSSNTEYRLPNHQKGNVLNFEPNRSKPAANTSGVYNHDSLGYTNDTDTGGDKFMDIEKYVDRLEQDRRDTEQRLRDDRRDMEQRLRDDRESMEQRLTESHRLSEERIETRFSEIMTRLDKSIDKMDQSKQWIIGVCVTTVIGIAAMVITVIIATQ